MDNLIANKKSKIYHNLSCYFGNLVLMDNRIDLDPDFMDPDKNTYRPCSKCKSHVYGNHTLDEFKKLKQDNIQLAEVS